MAQTSFDIDSKTAEALEELKRVYRVPSNAAAIKRALAIALTASRLADDENNINIVREKDGQEKTYVLPQQY